MAIDVKALMSDEKFHSANIDAEEFFSLINDVIRDTHPDDEIKSIDIDNNGMVNIILESGQEVEIEVDWNEIVLK